MTIWVTKKIKALDSSRPWPRDGCFQGKQQSTDILPEDPKTASPLSEELETSAPRTSSCTPRTSGSSGSCSATRGLAFLAQSLPKAATRWLLWLFPAQAAAPCGRSCTTVGTGLPARATTPQPKTQTPAPKPRKPLIEPDQTPWSMRSIDGA